MRDLPIFFSCDDKYVPFLAVALESLERNASRKFNYLIKVLHSNAISKENQKIITKQYGHDNFQIEFVDITSSIVAFSNQLHTRDYYSQSTYYRLFIPNLYPQFDKALYLDSDIVILGDVAELFNTEIGDNLVGAVPDESVQLIYEFQEYVINRIGVKSAKHYFNAGILLMNLKRLREIDFQNMFLELVKGVTFDVAQDQDYLNAICCNRVHYIDSVWDKMPFPNAQVPEHEIKLLHFNLDKKPWQNNGIMYEQYFWQYARLTPYYVNILEIKANYTDAQRQLAALQTVKLIEKTHVQAMEAAKNQRIAQIIKEVCRR